MRNILKPYGAFLEYTVKPLLDDFRELLEVAKEQGLPLGEIKKAAIFLYIFHELVNICITFGVTLAICYTCYTCFGVAK